jgi:2-methylcitrate dehydratase PrpD
MNEHQGSESADAGSVTGGLSRWAAKLTVDSIPPDVRSYTRALMADHLRSVSLGAETPWSGAIARVGRARGAAGPCAIGDLGPGADPATAAFVNGCFAHGADLDDTHVQAMLHPGAAVVPTVLALATTHGSSGASVLTALVAGYETAIRVALAVQPEHYQRGFQATGTCGALGAAVGASVLLGHTPAQVENAMGLAGSMAAGLARFYYAGGDAKRIHGGRAAEAGVLAAQMVEEGLTGPVGVLEGRAGFGGAYSDRFEPSRILGALGVEFRLLAVVMKVHATSARLQSIVDATGGAVVSGSVDPADTVGIEAQVPPLMRDRLTHADPPDVTSAQMSLPFTVALTAWVAHGESERPVLSVHDYEAQLHNREVRRLAAAMSIQYHEDGSGAPDAVRLSFMGKGGDTVAVDSGSETAPQEQTWAEAAGRLAELAPDRALPLHALAERISRLEHDDSAHDIAGELGRILADDS